MKALTYSQGDRQSLIDAARDFTTEGWREFMSRMVGFVDAKGAPQGGSSFTPEGDVVVRTDNRDVMKCDVPGTPDLADLGIRRTPLNPRLMRLQKPGA